GVEPRMGPLATAYVLILVVLGPVAARWTEPLGRRLTRRPPRTRLPAPTPTEPTEAARANG
ncbi:cation:proton antiporter, partial [Streptomyces sp. NPDC026672]